MTPKAKRNKTLILSPEERDLLSKEISQADVPLQIPDLENRVFQGDLLSVISNFPESFADLLILDPPYNLDKSFHGFSFSQKRDEEYLLYLMEWFPGVLKTLKPQGSLYFCGDWRSSGAIYALLKEQGLTVQNRITWQREKGRGAKRNWKNCSEDIWFATLGEEYFFNVEAVKMKRRVLAPYTACGKPKDWEETENGRFRVTHPSNFWDDITVPYWSMPENTSHPTQKPEKLIAKLILASCPEKGLVFDPFLGSGTSAVTAKKLDRRFCGVEVNPEYCLWSLKRLKEAEGVKRIQGYWEGFFWERNTALLRNSLGKK